MNFYKMRRKDRCADENVALAILREGEYGVLSTIGNDGFPYGVPLNYVFDGEKIYFHCALNAGHKQENLKCNKRVSFCVVSANEVIKEKFTTKFASVIVFGTAEKIVDDFARKHDVLKKLIEKYSPEFEAQGLIEIDSAINRTDIFEITVESLSAKINK